MSTRKYLKNHPELLEDPKWASRFCRALWRYRDKKHFSRCVLASHVGVEESDISRWETSFDPTRAPSPKQLLDWLEHFGFEFIEYRYDGVTLCGYPGGSTSVAARLYDSDSRRVTSL